MAEIARGILGILPKLEQKPLHQENYHQLIEALGDEYLHKFLNHAKHIRRNDLHMYEESKMIPKEFLASGILGSIKKQSHCQHLLLMIRVLQYAGIKMPQQEIENETKNMNDMESVAGWFKRKLQVVPFPPPPWKGNERITPICSPQELKNASKRFKNCARKYYFKALFGHCCFYICARPMAMIEINQDTVLGWSIAEIKGISNRKISAVCEKEIFQEFSAAGFCLLPVKFRYLHIEHIFDGDFFDDVIY